MANGAITAGIFAVLGALVTKLIPYLKPRRKPTSPVKESRNERKPKA